MRREPSQLAEKQFDLVIVGGGVYGAAAAWEAACRGLSVALVDKGDLGAATSANSLKIIHGGFRYLQSLDLPRLRRSRAEMAALLRLAPRWVRPLACLLPTRGFGKQSRLLLGPGLLVHALLTLDQPIPGVPAGRLLSRREVAGLCPLLADLPGLTGGALWHDAQVMDSERLVLAFLRSAAARGAAGAAGAAEIGRASGRERGCRHV